MWLNDEMSLRDGVSLMNVLTDESCYRCLATLGVDVWLPKSLAVQRQQPVESVTEKAMPTSRLSASPSSTPVHAQVHQAQVQAQAQVQPQEQARAPIESSPIIDTTSTVETSALAPAEASPAEQTPASPQTASLQSATSFTSPASSPTTSPANSTTSSVVTQPTPAAADSAVDGPVRYALTIQPVTDRVLMLCDQQDPDAPGLSSQEFQLLSGILEAASKLIDREAPPVSQNRFIWPVGAQNQRGQNSNPLFSDRHFALKAFEGLVSGQIKKGVSTVILLSEQPSLKTVLAVEEWPLHHARSLAAMAAGDRTAKGVLWRLLQQLI